jgi:DNA mismatch endonuclease (patch repair protein)
MMAGIGPKDTVPELRVRSYLHAAGLRFRLHDESLPGKPDLVLPRHRVAIFVHGCFWHRHAGCRFATTPSSNETFWARKFKQNVERDARKEQELREKGWEPLIVWECETKTAEGLDTVFWRVHALSRCAD